MQRLLQTDCTKSKGIIFLYNYIYHYIINKYN